MAKAAGKAETPQPDKAMLKKMFGKAMKKPMFCAVAKGPNNSVLMMMHKSKKGSGLKPLMEKEFGKDDISDVRWGTVSINKREDSKLAVLDMNKSLPGAAPKLKKWLKGCGVSKIRYMVDGSVVEEIVTAEPGDENEPELMEDDEDDEDEAEADNENETVSEDNESANQQPERETEEVSANQSVEPNQSTEPTQSVEPTQTSEPPPAPPPAPLDVAGLTKRLTDLVKRMASDPAKMAALRDMAIGAQTALKQQDPQSEAKIDAFEQALGQGGSTAAAPPAAPPAPPVDPAKQAALAASPKIWNDTISVVTSGVGALKEAIRKDFADEPPEVLADIEKNLSRIDQVTARFDKQLADLLDGVNAATDDAARKAGLVKARAVLAEHIKYAASEPLIGMIDQNPFGVSPDIKKTLVTNLTQLAAAIR